MSKSGYVAIIGRPNAGKSTLLNAVLGTQISIVTPKAQTTRDRVLGIFTEPEGQIVFIDTPGIHRAKEGGINEYMVNEAKEALESPNVVWYIIDPRSALSHEMTVIELLDKAPRVPVLLLFNKVDSMGKATGKEVIDQLESSIREALSQRKIEVAQSYRISALNELGLDQLIKDTWKYIPEGPLFYPDPDQVSDRPTRYFVAEKIREQLYHCLGDELPYSCAVEIQNYSEKTKPVRIEATIHVERESQKGMVIGKGGQKIKEIGQQARQEIEKFLGVQIFLGLKVNTRKNWTDDPQELKRIGYALPSQVPPKKGKAAV